MYICTPVWFSITNNLRLLANPRYPSVALNHYVAITGWPGAENNTRAGPTAAWIMGVYVQRDMGLAGIGFANLRNLRCEQVFDSSIDTFQLAAVFAPGSNPNATRNCFQVWTVRTEQRSVRYGVFIMIFGSSLGANYRCFQQIATIEPWKGQAIPGAFTYVLFLVPQK